LPTADRTRFGDAALLAKGAYVLADASGGRPSVILIGTGSEVSLCMAARETLPAEVGVCRFRPASQVTLLEIAVPELP
jgi:transketolase